ncbi:MAG: tyrosine-protein phosphatase [Synergistaceae bacterium]|nr:tyrosine-protein phosphatase [Synergistaceae bacterium]
MKKFAAVILILFAFVSCSFAEEKFRISHQTTFGGIIIDCSIEKFNSLGFEYGDSVNINFSNGKTLTDIPYYNGYYTKIGDPILIAYPGRENIWLQNNFGSDSWLDLGMKESDSVIISLNQRGKYKAVQEARDIKYFNDRNLYASDEVFANFRAMNIGRLKKNFVYRSASPCDNEHNRASYVDKLIKREGVKYILNLADNDENIKKIIAKSDFNSPYFLNLYENKCVFPIKLGADFHSDTYRKKLADGLAELSKHEGPYLIHCLEGKDRAGFASVVIGALAGASYDELVNDFMLSYANYYGITRENEPSKYNVLVSEIFDEMLKFVVNNENVDMKSINLAPYAEKFLLDSGMSESDLDALKSRIMN